MNHLPGKIITYFIFGIFGLVVAVLIQLERYRTMDPGTKIPELIFEGKMGKERLSHDTEKSTVIIWFHPDCKHCLYQLTQINDFIDLLGDTKFFFLTAEKNFPSTRHLGLWPNLTSADHVRFGVLNKERFMASFGMVITPTTFIFNKKGILVEKIFGEVKIQKIRHVLENMKIPNHSCRQENIN